MTTDIPTTPNTDENAENVIKFPSGKKANISTKQMTAKEAAAMVSSLLNSSDTIQPITPEDFDSNEDYLRRINIENLCNTFAMEIYFRLLSMGYDINTQEFAKDLEFAQEAIHSALLRTFNVSHPIQEYIDENFELVTVQTTTQELDT
jgi:hypothetical protein